MWTYKAAMFCGMRFGKMLQPLMKLYRLPLKVQCRKLVACGWEKRAVVRICAQKPSTFLREYEIFDRNF
jgi:hypothetical protein